MLKGKLVKNITQLKKGRKAFSPLSVILDSGWKLIPSSSEETKNLQQANEQIEERNK